MSSLVKAGKIMGLFFLMDIYKAGGCFPENPMVSSWDELGDRQLGTSHKGSCSDFLSCPVYTGKGLPHAVNTAQEKGHQLLQG